MITEKVKNLIELLTAKTLSKKAIWNKASADSQFKLSINDGSAITVREWTGQYNDLYYSITIFNRNGDAIERIDTEDLVYSPENIALFRSLHKAANDSYFKVEETIDALIASVNNQDLIGNNEIGDAPADDDDLPF